MDRTAPPVALDARRPGARPGGAGRPAARTGSRKVVRTVPVRDSAYAHLSLVALREYRAALQAEEGKVSYWRRILQARLDVVRAGTPDRGGSGVDLAPLLTDERVRSGRTALVEVLPVDDIPPLPSLGELWERRVDRDDLAAQARLEADLSDAEQQLSAYRSALHVRLAAATDELIARYREQPTLCLVALPAPPGRASR